METVYCGVDFHARKQTVSYLTTEDGEMQEIELLHEQDDVGGFYAQLQTQGQVIVGFESSGYAAWASSPITTNPSPPRRRSRSNNNNNYYYYYYYFYPPWWVVVVVVVVVV